MKLIKLINENEVLYFSSQTNAAKFLNKQQNSIRHAIVNKIQIKGYMAEYSYDNVMTNDVDKNID